MHKRIVVLSIVFGVVLGGAGFGVWYFRVGEGGVSISGNVNRTVADIAREFNKRESGSLSNVVPIYRYSMPAQTSTTTFRRMSKYYAQMPREVPLPDRGGRRVYRLLIKYADELPRSQKSLWRIYRPRAGEVADSFTFPGRAMKELNKAKVYASKKLDLPGSDWQVEVRMPSNSYHIRVFQIFLAVYD